MDLKIAKREPECLDIRISSETLQTPFSLIQKAKSEGIEIPAKNNRNLKLTLETPEFEAEKVALIEWGNELHY